MCLVIVARGNSSLGNRRHGQTLRLGQLPSSQGVRGAATWPSLLSVARSSPLPVPGSDQGVGGLHIKQSGVFDVDGNTNTDLNSRNSLFVPFSHSLSRLLNVYVFKGLAACAGVTVAKEALRGP